MDQAEKYLKHSTGIQYEVITSLMSEFENETSKMTGTVMDIGCGPGNNTKNLILPKISHDAVMIGLDISKNMVDNARILNTDEKRLTFQQLNIETTDLPVEYIEKFDNGFSFFCLHWIVDLRCAFQNIYKMLKPGGSLISQHILLFNGYNPYLRLSKNARYKEYLEDARKFITPLYFEENPRATLLKLLQEIGFQVLHCSIREKITGYESQNDRKELFEAVNPFVMRMPPDVKNDFMDNLMQETFNEETVLFRKNENPLDEDKIYYLYKFIMLHIKKPKN